jgi:RimJ/RimL family protein N-acetyltransferase
MTTGQSERAKRFRALRVREATPNDAAGIISLFNVIYAETTFMLLEPGEWNPTVEEQARLAALEAWARANGLHRLELTVQVHNRRAIALYEKCGFEREGVKRHSLNIEGTFIDELYMSKLIPA